MHHLFELLFRDFSLGISPFEYGFSVSVLGSVRVIPSSPGPEKPSYYPENNEYQKDASYPAKMKWDEWIVECSWPPGWKKER
jgi:hypothetical protein